MNWFHRLMQEKPFLAFFLKYLFLFTLLFISVALAALHKVTALESNPFFYANF